MNNQHRENVRKFILLLKKVYNENKTIPIIPEIMKACGILSGPQD
jgi:hypothetical protein